MQKELDYFRIDGSLGGQQTWFNGAMMRNGGCAVASACDVCIYMAKTQNALNLYPFDINNITKEDYVKFSEIMKPYLRPRMTGIYKLTTYVRGFLGYLRGIGEANISVIPFKGEEPVDKAAAIIKQQIDNNIPIPFLMLRNKNNDLADYVWHWFIIAGYKKTDDGLYVRAITYGTEKWLRFRDIWNTGYSLKGGMILIRAILNC